MVTPEDIKIEVKSAAYIQTWSQDKLSPIKFDIEKKKGWDPKTNIVGNELRRNADVYVFCLLSHQDQPTIDPLNVDQWRFFVHPTKLLDQQKPDQKSIHLKPLLKLGVTEVPYNDLYQVIKTLAPSKVFSAALHLDP